MNILVSLDSILFISEKGHGIIKLEKRDFPFHSETGPRPSIALDFGPG
jgi:hypothetical protein